MKLTKRQIAALNRIISDERSRNGEAGLHPSVDKFAISDGSAVVLFDEKPDGFPEASPFDLASNYIMEFIEKSTCCLVEDSQITDTCKCAIREWKAAHNLGKSSIPEIQLSAVDEKGNRIESWFDARKLLNVVEAMGAGALVYIGKDETHGCPLPCALVKRKNWIDSEDDYQALLLPWRPIHGGA